MHWLIPPKILPRWSSCKHLLASVSLKVPPAFPRILLISWSLEVLLAFLSAKAQTPSTLKSSTLERLLESSSLVLVRAQSCRPYELSSSTLNFCHKISVYNLIIHKDDNRNCCRTWKLPTTKQLSARESLFGFGSYLVSLGFVLVISLLRPLIYLKWIHTPLYEKP